MDVSCSYRGGPCNTHRLHLLNEGAFLLSTQSCWLSHCLTGPDGKGQNFPSPRDAGGRINQLVTQLRPKVSTCMTVVIVTMITIIYHYHDFLGWCQSNCGFCNYFKPFTSQLLWYQPTIITSSQMEDLKEGNYLENKMCP